MDQALYIQSRRVSNRHYKLRKYNIPYPPESLVTRVGIDYRYDAGHNGIKPTITYINNHRKTNLYMSIHRNMSSRIETTNYKPYKHEQHDTHRYETVRDG